MPGKGTTRRSIRVPDDVWLPARDLADSRGEDLSTVLRDALADYLEQHDESAPIQP